MLERKCCLSQKICFLKQKYVILKGKSEVIGMYKIAICDDDEKYIIKLKKMIEEVNRGNRELQFVAFTSGKELLDGGIEDMSVIFLDIQMKEMNGNEVSTELRGQGYQGVLVHCSGIFMPTPETIRISPYRYILKQDSSENIRKEIIDILEEMDRRRGSSTIEASYLREKIRIRLDDIVYITHRTNGTSTLHLVANLQKKFVEGDVIVPYNFVKIMQMLGTVDFAIPHNSFIVNMHYVALLTKDNEFVFVAGKKIPISRGRKREFMQKWVDYSAGKYRRSER